MESEDRSFLEYCERPTRETLVALLRTHQSTVYNVCFQILRNGHDAEDAAQEVLLEVIRGAGRIREPRAFKRWLCRAALHTALDHLRRRARRSRLEKVSVPMIPESPDRAVDALHEALGRLDDEDRCLLVEKYFDQATLEQLAAREGLSTAAVWKRIERARERLKKLMAGAGMSVAVPGLDSMLESLRPVPVPPDLITGSLSVKAALASFGGAVMGTKALISGTTIVVALIFLMIGAGSGYLVGAKRIAGTPSEPRRGAKSDVETAGPTDLSNATAVKSDSASIPADPKSGGASPAGENELVARLDRFRAWLEAYDAKHQIRSPQDMERRLLLLKDELEGVRELILADPAKFLAWIGRRESRAPLRDLFDATLAEKPSLYAIQSHEFSSFPASLTDGLLVLLQNGDVSQRQAIISFARFLRNPSDAYRSQFVTMLSVSDPFVGPEAAQALLSTSEPTAAEVEAVVRFAERLENDVSRQLVVQGLGRVPRAETREWLLQALESERFPDPRGRLAWAALEWWIGPGNSPGGAFEDRAARILSAAMRRTTDSDGYFMSLCTALNLPIQKSLPLIEQAAAGAPTEKLRKAAAAVLQESRAEGASPRALQEKWMSAYNEK